MTRVLAYKTQFFFIGTVISFVISCATLKTPFDLRSRCSPVVSPCPWYQVLTEISCPLYRLLICEGMDFLITVISTSLLPVDHEVTRMHFLFNINDLTVTTEYFSKFIISHSNRCIIYYDLNHSCFWAVLKFDMSIEDVQPLHVDFVLYWFIFER